MLTLPRIVERAAQPYVAVRERVEIPFGPVIDRVMPEIMGWVASRGIEPAGPPFFKYNLIDMPRLEVEFAVPTARLAQGDARVLAQSLPAGRYVEMTYWGPYDNLVAVTAMLNAWADQQGVAWDSHETNDGEAFAARLEVYLTNPAEEPDTSKWQTQLLFKIRE